jgi:hypothetical protein
MSRTVFGETPYFGAIIVQFVIWPLFDSEAPFDFGRMAKISAASFAVSLSLFEDLSSKSAS